MTPIELPTDKLISMKLRLRDLKDNLSWSLEYGTIKDINLLRNEIHNLEVQLDEEDK